MASTVIVWPQRHYVGRETVYVYLPKCHSCSKNSRAVRSTKWLKEEIHS